MIEKTTSMKESVKTYTISSRDFATLGGLFLSLTLRVPLLLASGITNPLGPFPTSWVQCSMKKTDAVARIKHTRNCRRTLPLRLTLVVLEVILAVKGPIAEVTAFALVLIKTMIVFNTWLQFNVMNTGMTSVQKFSALLVTLHAALLRENMNTSIITKIPV